MVKGDKCTDEETCSDCPSIATDGGRSDGEETRFSLSRRDTIKGVIGGGVVAANVYLFNNIRQSRVAAEPTLRERFSNQIQLNVNGETRHVNVDDQERLLETLRYKMGLTGGKFGCDRAMCGACTIEVDGEPIYGCTYFTRDAVGKEIVTIEGLEENGQLHPLQEAFIETMGGQCAYCTPGMIMSGKALLDENGDPSREEVRQALSGVLCRCGNYEQEIQGVLEAAERM
ncbi:(2Fe-2S)-binding protein [Natronorarus salvus]|uniref:(2Fe-2S)-binding protein n=1 Tax=Natronorarus salvus TaxID=3117733 RepID=UPI002F2656AC